MMRLQALIDALQARDPVAGDPAEADLAHRWSFVASGEAVLIVNAATRRVVEVNLEAAELLGKPRPQLIGRTFPRGLDRGSAAAALALFDRVSVAASADTVTLRAFDGGRELGMGVSLFSVGAQAYFLVHLRDVRRRAGARPALAAAPTLQLMDEARAPIVVTDLLLHVQYANRAFHELAGLPTTADLVGQSLTRWLDLSDDDLRAIATQGENRQATLTVATTLRSASLAVCSISACVVVVPDGEMPCCAFLLDAPGR